MPVSELKALKGGILLLSCSAWGHVNGIAQQMLTRAGERFLVLSCTWDRGSGNWGRAQAQLWELESAQDRAAAQGTAGTGSSVTPLLRVPCWLKQQGWLRDTVCRQRGEFMKLRVRTQQGLYKSTDCKASLELQVHLEFLSMKRKENHRKLAVNDLIC